MNNFTRSCESFRFRNIFTNVINFCSPGYPKHSLQSQKAHDGPKAYHETRKGTHQPLKTFCSKKGEEKPPPNPSREQNSVRQRWGGAEPASEQTLLPLHLRRRVIMAMATSRLLWASRAASYLKISTFPRAFSTGTSPLLSSPRPPLPPCRPLTRVSRVLRHACTGIRGLRCWSGAILPCTIR
jgi:hypothetical protein